MKVLNLYAGIGGNRKLWENVDVTAVEIDPSISKVYRDFFPDDKVLVEDAHQYLLDHFKEYDFIWSSPPCPTHSRMFKNVVVPRGQSEPRYPDMRLYQEVLLLRGYFNGLFCVENVISWYKPLVRPQVVGRHYFWSNFYITDIRIDPTKISQVGATNDYWVDRYGMNINDYDLSVRRDKVYQNCVDPILGAHVLKCARGSTQQQLSNFVSLKEAIK